MRFFKLILTDTDDTDSDTKNTIPSSVEFTCDNKSFILN